MSTCYELSKMEVIVPAVTEVALALIQTKFPVKLYENIVELWSVSNCVSPILNQSSFPGSVASDPCILIDPVSVDDTLYDTVCIPSGLEKYPSPLNLEETKPT